MEGVGSALVAEGDAARRMGAPRARGRTLERNTPYICPARRDGLCPRRRPARRPYAAPSASRTAVTTVSGRPSTGTTVHPSSTSPSRSTCATVAATISGLLG